MLQRTTQVTARVSAPADAERESCPTQALDDPQLPGLRYGSGQPPSGNGRTQSALDDNGKRTIVVIHFALLLQSCFGEETEADGAVVSAESEGVAQHTPDRGRPGLIGHVVQVAFGVGRFVVNSRRDDAVCQREARGGKPCGPRRPHQMPDHALGRADGSSAGLILAEDAFDGQRLELVVQRGGGAVGVDVVDVGGSDPGVPQGRSIQRTIPRASGSGSMRLCASVVIPTPRISA